MGFYAKPRFKVIEKREDALCTNRSKTILGQKVGRTHDVVIVFDVIGCMGVILHTDNIGSCRVASNFTFELFIFFCTSDDLTPKWMKAITRVQFFGTFILTFFFLTVKAQPSIEWQKCIGGSQVEQGGTVNQTPDGGFIFVGSTYSTDGDATGNHDTTGSTTDILVVKMDDLGNIQWSKCLGGSQYDNGTSVTITLDSGYLVAGWVGSIDGDVIGNHGSNDAWLVKLDSLGNILWSRCYGGSDIDGFRFVKQLNNGDFIIAGFTRSNDGDVTINHLGCDIWALRIHNNGVIMWQKSFGGSSYDDGHGIDETTDLGYILGGTTYSNDLDVSGHHNTAAGDFWVVKLDSNANIIWQKCLGGFDHEEGPRAIRETSDSGFIALGATQSYNSGHVTGSHGDNEYWLVKTDSDGVLLWQKCFGGQNYDVGISISPTLDNGFILTGAANSNNTGNVTGNHGSFDFWIVKINNTGDLEWQKSLGSQSYEYAFSIQQTQDSGYIVAGITDSPVANGDVSGNHSAKFDFWIVKLSSVAVGVKNLSEDLNPIDLFPNPAFDKLTVRSKHLTMDRIEIYDILGQRIHEIQTHWNTKEITIETAYLPAGLYIIKIYEDARQLTRKFIKQ